LDYIAPSSGALSVRVNPFRAQGAPVRTVARYVMASGERIISVKGPIQRVTFDPGRLEVTRQFALRGLQSLVEGWDALLLLGCLLVPIRRARTVAALVAAVAVAQVAGVVIGTIARSEPQTLATLQVVAASGIVVASIQNIAGARLQWVRALALGFGVVYGFSQGNELSVARPFAGGHAVLAAVVFMSVSVFSQAWTATVLWLLRRWLDDRGLSERIATIGLSGLIAHSAIHRVLERGQAVESEFERLVTQLTIGWVVVILAVAAIEAVRMRARMAHVPPTRADA
jgi:HupE/UreJ protein